MSAIKKLRIWLLKNDLTLSMMAKDLGVNICYMRQLFCMAIPFTLPMAQKIEAYTKGQVTASHLLLHEDNFKAIQNIKSRNERHAKVKNERRAKASTAPSV